MLQGPYNLSSCAPIHLIPYPSSSQPKFSFTSTRKSGIIWPKVNIVIYSTPNSELPDTNLDSPPAPHHPPLTIYRLPLQLFVQNKPNLHKPQIWLNSLSCKGLCKKHRILPHKSKPKQTQSKPIRPPFFARYGTPNPKQTQANPNKPNLKTGNITPKPPKPPTFTYSQDNSRQPVKQRRAFWAGIYLGTSAGRRGRFG
jgi:hypothetical protein